MIILILWVANALFGLAIGIASFRVLVIALASPLVAFFSVALLCVHDFGLLHVVLVPIGSLVAVQSFYFLGISIRHLTTAEADGDRNQDGERSTHPRKATSRLGKPSPQHCIVALGMVKKNRPRR
jgi:hypothetical protein